MSFLRCIHRCGGLRPSVGRQRRVDPTFFKGLRRVTVDSGPDIGVYESTLPFLYKAFPS